MEQSVKFKEPFFLDRNERLWMKQKQDCRVTKEIPMLSNNPTKKVIIWAYLEVNRNNSVF